MVGIGSAQRERSKTVPVVQNEEVLPKLRRHARLTTEPEFPEREKVMIAYDKLSGLTPQQTAIDFSVESVPVKSSPQGHSSDMP